MPFLYLKRVDLLPKLKYVCINYISHLQLAILALTLCFSVNSALSVTCVNPVKSLTISICVKTSLKSPFRI